MVTEYFETQTTNTLNQRRRLSKVAIMIALCGAFFALGAVTYKYNVGTELANDTIWLSLMAILTTISVVFELRKTSKKVGRRRSI